MMGKSITAFEHIQSNNFKTILLILLFPCSLVALFYIVYLIIGLSNKNLNFDFLTYANDLKLSGLFIYVLCAYATLISLFPLISICRLFKGEQRIFLAVSHIVSVGLIGSFGLNGSISFFADYRPTIFSGLVIVFMILEIIFSIRHLQEKNYVGELLITK